MLKGKLLSNLYDLYEDHDPSWVQSNSWVLNNARRNSVSIGGSIALAIGGKQAFKHPGDIDLFTENELDAIEFISQTIQFLASTKNSNYYSLCVNNKTSRCLEGVTSHYRLIVPFWKPICLMVMAEEFPFYYYHGLRVQSYNFVKQKAMEVTLIDGKDRVGSISYTNDLYEYDIDLDDDDLLDDWEPFGTSKKLVS